MKLISICILFLLFLVTCKKSTPVEEVVDQPITVGLEINGEQSHEVRVK